MIVDAELEARLERVGALFDQGAAAAQRQADAELARRVEYLAERFPHVADELRVALAERGRSQRAQADAAASERCTLMLPAHVVSMLEYVAEREGVTVEGLIEGWIVPLYRFWRAVHGVR